MPQRIVLIVIALIVVSGCRQSDQPATEQTAANISLNSDPILPAVGEATLLVRLTDADNNPINDANVEARGDMNHAGMAPVLAVAEEAPTDGRYRIPFNFTMGGDWIITITATLADDTVVTKTFDFVGISDVPMVDLEVTVEDCGIIDEHATAEATPDCAVPPTPFGIPIP